MRMKIAFLLSGFLLIIFGGHAESKDFSHWQDRLKADFDRMHQRLKEEAEGRQKRFEADAKRRENEATALWKRLEADAKRREEKTKAFWRQFEIDNDKRKEEAKARQKKFQAELNELKEKCAKKGFSNDADDYSKSTSTVTNGIDGFKHTYVQTYNPTTKKIFGSYYRINEHDPTAEPICGKLEIEPTSDDFTSQNFMTGGDYMIGEMKFGYQNEDEFVELGRKCAAKGFPNDIVGTKRMVTLMMTIDGIRHIYLQTYNNTTNKVSGIYFSTNKNGELTCGKLKIESTS